jgi:hypothetical protein
VRDGLEPVAVFGRVLPPRREIRCIIVSVYGPGDGGRVDEWKTDGQVVWLLLCDLDLVLDDRSTESIVVFA